MKRIREIAAAIEDWVTGILLFIGVSLIFYGVVMRYVFNRPSDWVDEVSLYFVVWGILLGAAVALRENKHIRVSLLYSFLPVTTQRYVRMVSNIISLLFCIFFTVYGIELEQSYIHSGQRSMNILIPLWIVYAAIPITGVMLSIRFIEQIWETIAHGGKLWIERQYKVEEDEKHGGGASI